MGVPQGTCKTVHIEVPLSSRDPMYRIYVDIIEDLRVDADGNQHILVLIDSFSRWLNLIPVELVSDRGPGFIGEAVEMFLNLIGTEHELTMAYSKEENGMVERANKETLRHLPLVKRIFNSSIHSVTGVAPAHVIFGHAVNLDRNIFKQPTASTVDTESMSQWMGDLIQGQQTIMELVKKNLDKQREKHVEKQINPDFTEFPIDSYVLVEHVGNTLRRGPKSKLFPFLKGPV